MFLYFFRLFTRTGYYKALVYRRSSIKRLVFQYQISVYKSLLCVKRSQRSRKKNELSRFQSSFKYFFSSRTRYVVQPNIHYFFFVKRHYFSLFASWQQTISSNLWINFSFSLKVTMRAIQETIFFARKWNRLFRVNRPKSKRIRNKIKRPNK